MIDISSLDVSKLPSLSLSDRATFPEIPCIYLAIDSLGMVQYIGQSINLRRRWKGHHRLNQLTECDANIAWIEVSDPSLLNEIEIALIEWFDPPLNEMLGGNVTRLKPKEAYCSSIRLYCRLAVLMAEKDPQLSQRRVAEETKLGIATVNRLFTNRFTRIDVATVETLCAYFGRGINDLFELRDEEEIPKRKTRKRS